MPDPTPHEAPASGRERLQRALTRPSRGQAVVAVLLGLLAFAAITQVRDTQVDDADFAGYREQDLIDVLTGLAGTSQRAEAEISRLEDTRDELRSDSDRRQAALGQARTEAETLRILAGQVPVTGPGLRITVKEKTGPVSAETLLDMVQELRTGSAEAIQVDGQVRLVAQSAFSEGVGGIVIDGQQLEPPYVFDVIGDPHSLEGALTFPLGPRYQVEEIDGGTLTFKDPGRLEITAVRDVVDPEYAQAAPGQ
ncbi:DUF881 domain-containing protein [Nocardioides lianchengensis]|uniref:Uncharacterized conserved protein YlxW, UPF0749 family n=1 Tax=Nocardioides lianchengensis TaxID=1045774 RepID=A0A1G7B9Q9_9ACTN|nr:DUF881 domain-containing protein [Nocardioides lianchengensis]NYG10057.1 uncharacterized protein YlxW (UPF0749 family) [Nocardioides lianchengensis]SDE23753.1 Uncharacterized conserved protein YlxW, UPF0749 family [Nocardioides lianchengensis]